MHIIRFIINLIDPLPYFMCLLFNLKTPQFNVDIFSNGIAICEFADERLVVRFAGA